MQQDSYLTYLTLATCVGNVGEDVAQVRVPSGGAQPAVSHVMLDSPRKSNWLALEHGARVGTDKEKITTH